VKRGLTCSSFAAAAARSPQPTWMNNLPGRSGCRSTAVRCSSSSLRRLAVARCAVEERDVGTRARRKGPPRYRGGPDDRPAIVLALHLAPWLSEVALAKLDSHPWEAPREAAQRWLTESADGCTAHDLGRTFSTRNNGMGVPPYVVEKMLNHTFDGVMAVYNHAAYDAERRQALEDSSAYLMEMASPSAAVVPLRSRVTRTA
jgi:integrase